VHEKPADGRTITKNIGNPIHPIPPLHKCTAGHACRQLVSRAFGGTRPAPTFWFGFRRKTVLAKADLKTALSSSATTTIFFATPLLQFYPLSRDFFLPLRSELRARASERSGVCVLLRARRRLSFCVRLPRAPAQPREKQATSPRRRQAALSTTSWKRRENPFHSYICARRCNNNSLPLSVLFLGCAPSPRPKHGPFLNPPRPTLLLFFPLLFFHSVDRGRRKKNAIERGWVR
jgi:hypothetical protein